MMSTSEGVVRLLLGRLSDAVLGTVVATLAAACTARPDCSRVLSLEQKQAIVVPRDAVHVPADGVQVQGTDVLLSDGWSLLFSTPLYSTTLQQADNTGLLKIIDAERLAQSTATRSADGARSLAGNGWRTNDHFLNRPEKPIRRLRALLLEQAKHVVQYGQPTKLDLDLYLSGWAVSLGAGGRQIDHVHPHASWSGVYYVRGGGASKHGGGCLRVTDPRPAAQMVTLGPNDQQVPCQARTAYMRLPSCCPPLLGARC